MTAQNGKYPMKAVARLTGLSPDTIRAWERRYGAIAPERSDGAHRLYSDGDVERLILLRRVTEAGHGIGRASRLPDDDLRKLVAPWPVAPEVSSDVDFVARILAATDAYDHLGAERELTRAAMLLPPRRVVLEVAHPLLAEVGRRWADGMLSIGQEHLISEMVRSLLGTLLRVAEPTPGRPALVLATLSGERHELGALMVALLAAQRGVPVCYLGPDAPVGEVATAARRTGAGAVGISLVRLDDPVAVVADVWAIAAGLPPTTALWLGGRAAGLLPKAALPPRARVLDALADLDEELDQLGR